MPVYEGIDIPAVEWCSIRQAIMWIEFGQVPVEPCYENLLPDRVTEVSEERWASGKRKLFLHASTAGVTLHGMVPEERGQYPVAWEGSRPVFDCVWHGNEPVPVEDVISAGIDGLYEDGVWGEKTFSDSLLAPPFYMDPQDYFCYANLKVYLPNLLARYPAPAGVSFRIGGEPRRVEELGQGAARPGWVPLAEAVRLVAFGDIPLDDVAVDEAHAERLAQAHHVLRLAIEAGAISSRASVGWDCSDGTPYGWDPVPAGPWGESAFDWERSRLKIVDGGYLEVWLNEEGVRRLMARLPRSGQDAICKPVLGLPAPQAELSEEIPEEKGAPLYTTRLLSAVDVLRPKIALAPMTWTKAAIEAECRAMGIGLGHNDLKALGAILLPDAKRGKP